jgi:glycine hydroxymethyltransferase
MILTNDEEMIKKINKVIFPGIQGGPLMHIIAAKATAFNEALKPEFKEYQKQVVKNAHVLSEELIKGGLRMVSGGTDNHMVLVDLTNKDLTGKAAEKILEEANITVNKNGIPYDTKSPFITSGIRIGTPALTTRGMKEEEMKEVAELILRALDSDASPEILKVIKNDVATLCKKFPLYRD